MTFKLETDLSGVSITQLGIGENEKGSICTLMYTMYKRARPIPDGCRTSDNRLTLWTEPFVTHNEAMTHISLWEPGFIYRLPQSALDILKEGDDLCAAPLRIGMRHTPYPCFTVDEHNRGSADGKRNAVTTVLHIGAYTPCLVAPREKLVDWIDCLSGVPSISPFFASDIDRRGLSARWLEPLMRAGDVRIEHLPSLLDRPVDLIREEVSRETA